MIAFHRVTKIELTEPKAAFGSGVTNEILIHMEDMPNPVQLDLFAGDSSCLRFIDNKMKTFVEIIREMAQVNPIQDKVVKGEEF